MRQHFFSKGSNNSRKCFRRRTLEAQEISGVAFDEGRTVLLLLLLLLDLDLMDELPEGLVELVAVIGILQLKLLFIHFQQIGS